MYSWRVETKNGNEYNRTSNPNRGLQNWVDLADVVRCRFIPEEDHLPTVQLPVRRGDLIIFNRRKDPEYEETDNTTRLRKGEEPRKREIRHYQVMAAERNDGIHGVKVCLDTGTVEIMMTESVG